VPDATLPFPFSGNVSRAPSAADIFLDITAGRTVLHNAVMSKALLTAICLLVSHAALAEEQAAPPTAAAPSTQITIYSSAKLDDFDASRLIKAEPGQVPGMAIIQWRRTFELNEGESRIDIPGIASTADFSTLSLRPTTADAFKVLSQSLVEPAADPEAFLRRAIGHEIIINRKAPPIGDHRAPETINAKLIAFDANQLVVQTSNRQLPVQIIPRNADIAEIKLLADSAPTRVAVSAQISSSKGGPQEAILSYHASGFTWHADYEIVIGDDQSKANLTGTITMLNRSRASFDDARISLIASRPGPEGEKQIYSLPQPASLAADSAQRVGLLDAPGISCQMVLACTAADAARSGAFVPKYLAIENSSKNNLGRSLPAGRVRVVKQSNADAAPTLLIDAVLPAGAQDDLILVRIGPASAVTAKREIIERLDTNKSAVNQTIKITLRNSTDQLQKILLIEPRPGLAAQIIEKSDEFQTQSQSLLWKLDLPANGEKIVSYTTRRPAQ